MTDICIWQDDRNKINAGKILCCGVGVGAAIIAFVGLALFVIWVFGGLVIGIWFEFSSWEIFKDLGVFKIILAPSTPIAIRLAEILSLIMKAEIGGGEVWKGQTLVMSLQILAITRRLSMSRTHLVLRTLK